MARMTNAEAAGAAKAYADACTYTGLLDADLAEQVRIARPYGQVWYLVRYDKEQHRYDHDLPGFGGSGGSGRMSRSELVELVRFSTGMIYDVNRIRNGG
jgi:hypothetical protein